MTTVKEFKKWLSQFDEDTIIDVGKKVDENFHLKSKQDVEFGEVEGIEFSDFRTNQFTKPGSWWFKKQVLTFRGD
jgi:hypothetical protein